MKMQRIGTEQVAIFVLGATMVAVGYLGLTGDLTVNNLISGAGATSIALLAFSLGRHRSDPERA